jgi:hypothetical protein
MSRYFKLVCLHEDPQWYLEEFRQGRARYGWSGPGSNCAALKPRLMRENGEIEPITKRRRGFIHNF